MTGLEIILQEQAEQRNKHSYTPQFDAIRNKKGELLQAAFYIVKRDPKVYKWPAGWSYIALEKIMVKSEVGRLAVAGALMMSEIDRLKSFCPKSDKRAEMIAAIEEEIHIISKQIDDVINNPVFQASKVIAAKLDSDPEFFDTWVNEITGHIMSAVEDYEVKVSRKRLLSAVQSGAKDFILFYINTTVE